MYSLFASGMLRNIRKSKKGQYFELDAIIAIMLLIAGFIYMSNIEVKQPNNEQGITYSKEAVKLLKSMSVGDLNPVLINNMRNQSSYTNTEFSIARQISIYTMTGNTSLAENLTHIILDELIPSSFGYGVYLVNSSDYTKAITIANRTSPTEEQSIYVSKSMVSGLGYKEYANEENPDIIMPSLIEVRVWQ